MKKSAILLLLPLLLFLGSCSKDPSSPSYDRTPPFPPVGITSTSLDNAVELRWIENQEQDLAGYNIYASSSYNGHYSLIGTSRSSVYTDRGARNGVTFYYAVTSFDYSGNESDLSRDVVYDTPRPEGRGVTLIDRFTDPRRGGYEFAQYRVVHYDTDYTDVYMETGGNGFPYLVVWDDTDIQDMGYTTSIDEISVAPDDGWSPSGDALAIKGHTYVIWTHDNHFAKIRITDASRTTITFDWAYQTAIGNPELFTRERPVLAKRSRTGATARSGR